MSESERVRVRWRWCRLLQSEAVSAMAAAEQFRNRRWRGRRQVQESESVACTRKCHGYAVGGVDGAEALRGCTLRRACASVSKWRASERAVCRPSPKKNLKTVLFCFITSITSKKTKSRRSPREACALGVALMLIYDRCEGDGGGRPVAADLEMVRRWRLRKVVSNLTAARRSADEAADDHTGNCE